MKLKFTLFYCLILTCGFITSSFASEDNLPAPFKGHNANSKYVINYMDYDAILRTSVLTMGKSTRARAKKKSATLGTRLRSNINKLTALEGNRFFFESYKDEEYRQLITKIHESLESLPTTVALKEFSKDEQLAYWLNLYNVTMLDELNKIYPKRKLKDLYDDDSFLYDEILEVAGIKLSLNDIQYKILAEKYKHDPLIIYGLYQGIIGSPNIRNRAYTGKNVYDELEANANDFINSNRGTYGNDKKAFRVSSLYARNEIYFPKFKEDLTKHLLTYLEGYTRYQLENSKKIKTNIKDWNITDIYGSERSFGGGVATNDAALLDPYGSPEVTGTVRHFDGDTLTFRATGARPGGDAGNAGFHNASSISMKKITGQQGRFTAEQIKLLHQLNDLRLENMGIVTITDLTEEVDAEQN